MPSLSYILADLCCAEYVRDIAAGDSAGVMRSAQCGCSEGDDADLWNLHFAKRERKEAQKMTVGLV